MADFFEDKPVADEAPEKITIGGQEYDPTELEGLVSLGKLGKEVEEKYNTKLDRVFPEYTKATQKVKELEPQVQELATLKAQIASQQQNQGGLTPEQVTQAKMELERIMGGQIVTKPELDNYFNDRTARENNTKKLETGIESLMSDIKANGKPEVSKEELLGWMQENFVGNPDYAYKLMKEAELEKWKMAKLDSGRRQGLHTISGSMAGGKEPSQVRPTAQNLGDLVKEALGDTSE